MFGHFIPLIVVLLIYGTYQVAETPNFPLSQALALLVFATLVFAALAWSNFALLLRRMRSAPLARLDHRFNAIINRHIILAVVLFTFVIYGLNLPVFTYRIKLLAAAPTLEALLYLALFVLFLAVIYGCAHRAYRRIYREEISLGNYVISNITIAIPILIPWVLLSGIADILQNLPFDWPRQVLASAEGQAAYFLIFLVLVAFSAPYLIQKLWRCQTLEPGFYRTRIEAVCRQAEIKYNEIKRWPIFGGRMITAGVMGLVKQFRYILVTDALLQTLDPDELDAVIAHEIGHVKRHHLLYYIFFMMGLAIALFASPNFILIFIIYIEATYNWVASLRVDQTLLFSAAQSILYVLIFLFYFRIIFGFFMRNFERQADLYAFEMFGSVRPLINTFHKIARFSGQSPDKPNWHHFSIQQRIDYLERCEADPTWIKRHDRKLRNSIVIYLVSFLTLITVGYHFNYGAGSKHLNTVVLTKIYLHALEKTPDNPALYSLLGDLYLSENRYSRAREAYYNALRLAPNAAGVLNNLAWLLATCPDEHYRNPKEALALAQRAARLKPGTYILDTLAESYFANGLYPEAVEAEKMALRLTPKNRSYYESQLKKFEAAAKKKF